MTDLEISWIPCDLEGRLGITPHLRGNEWLEDEIRALAAEGVHLLVSLLTPAETRELSLGDEPGQCRRAGVEFVSFPIEEFSVPESLKQTRDLAARILEELRQGRTVIVQCRQGIGRSSLIAALVLVETGQSVDEAFAVIRRARRAPVPDTAEQREWVAVLRRSPRGRRARPAVDRARREISEP